MTAAREQPRAVLMPRLADSRSKKIFRQVAKRLAASSMEPAADALTDDVLAAALDEAAGWPREDRQALIAAIRVLADLAVQGWSITIEARGVLASPPVEISGDIPAEKTRVRGQELVRRDAQLAQPAVRRFVEAMERPRIVASRPVSIFSLMRDGRELAERLREARGATASASALRAVIDPYLEFVTDRAVCRFTSLPLMDVWRYFRHTWSNQYTSVPGRGTLFLVRDRAASFHPIVGIGALASPIMQIRERDEWIGWHPDRFLDDVRAHPTPEVVAWARRTIDTAIAETYVEDLLAEKVITPRELEQPTDTTIAELSAHGHGQRERHHRFIQNRDHKSTTSAHSRSAADDWMGATEARSGDLSPAEARWIARAGSHLFRSKRALALAEYLDCRRELRALGTSPSTESVGEFLGSASGAAVLRRVLRKAKGDRVGIALADISVCGAVQPYNAILGGKLVSMLAASPEVVAAYQRKYAETESEIASSMAGRSIRRPAQLVFLGTTSLYGIGSSQYNRISIPTGPLGGRGGEHIRFAELGHSEAFGTSQYSEETVEALADLVQQSSGGRRVNSIFGEGISPKLRKVRHGLDLLGFPAEVLLRHHRRRVIYGVSLVRNLRGYLLGLDEQPDYLVSPERGSEGSDAIAEWWRTRWLARRVCSDEVLAEVARHTLVRPIRHGARVPITRSTTQGHLFDDD